MPGSLSTFGYELMSPSLEPYQGPLLCPHLADGLAEAQAGQQQSWDETLVAQHS